MMGEPKLDVDVIPEEILSCMKACADPNRLRIFGLLLQGESCNAFLNEALGLAPNLLSHHLRVLREAGLVRDRRDSVDARWIYYSVDEKGLQRWYRWLTDFFDPAQLATQQEVCGPEYQQQQEASLLKPLADELENAPAFQEQNS